MILHSRLAVLLVFSLSFVPAIASQPEGLAARLVTDLGDMQQSDLPLECDIRPFEWYEFFGEHQLDSGDTLTVEMAILPFSSGETYVGLDDVDSDATFVGITFADGMVQGLSYDRSRWNDVALHLHPATQDYTLTVNGVEGGPFAYEGFCQGQGGCFSIQALRFHGFSNKVGSAAWIDTISVSKQSAAGVAFLHEVTFDHCPGGRPYVVGAAVVIDQPPARLRMRQVGLARSNRPVFETSAPDPPQAGR